MDQIDRLHAMLDQPPVSLDAPLADDPDAATIGDRLQDQGPTPEDRLLERDRRELVIKGLRVLTDRERAVLGLRFADWPLRDIGAAMDLPRDKVRQIESCAVETMRAAVLEQASEVRSAAQEASGGDSLETQATGSVGAVIAQVAMEARRDVDSG